MLTFLAQFRRKTDNWSSSKIDEDEGDDDERKDDERKQNNDDDALTIKQNIKSIYKFRRTSNTHVFCF